MTPWQEAQAGQIQEGNWWTLVGGGALRTFINSSWWGAWEEIPKPLSRGDDCVSRSFICKWLYKEIIVLNFLFNSIWFISKWRYSHSKCILLNGVRISFQLQEYLQILLLANEILEPEAPQYEGIRHPAPEKTKDAIPLKGPSFPTKANKQLCTWLLIFLKEHFLCVSFLAVLDMWDKPKVHIDKVLLSDPEGPETHKECKTKGDR